MHAQADGVSDDYLAKFYQQLYQTGPSNLVVEQACLAIGDCALLSFPGELYTEIGQHIKTHSPFRWTFIIGLASGYVGYVPTKKATTEGGYAVDTRRVTSDAEGIVVKHSLALLQKTHDMSSEEG